MKLLLKILYISIGILSYITIPQYIFAADFRADYDTQYAVSPSGTTIVTQNITLTNKQSNLYPKQYMISIDSEKIKNVIAYDAKGVITPKISQQHGKTDITVAFNQQTVGIDKQTPFSIRYENGNIAQQLGNIWEIHIPGVTNDDTLGEYTVSLQTPSSFPQNAYMTPLPAAGNRWTKEQLLAGGISAGYGDFQSYVVDITYNLQNESVSSVLTTIAIPADNAYQTVSIDSINPKPKEMKKDEDGNWIATFELSGKQNVDVIAKLHVQTYNKAKITTPVPIDIKKYTQPLRYWEADDPKILALAKQYTTPRAIYDYVVKTLSYATVTNQETIRKGALGALADPTTSVCTEFTDLFVSIARAAGIPAREVIGYAYTTDTKLRPLLTGSDVLHAWPEYYDTVKQLWIPIDPTWGNTTGGVNYFDVFDFNHIAFVVHGISSETPYPAGSYKEGSIPRKNISVTFAPVEKTTTTINSFRTTFLIPETVNSGKSLDGTIQIENLGNTTAESVNVVVQSNPFYFTAGKKETNIPPFGIISIPVHIAIPNYFAKGKGEISVSVNGEVTNFIYTVSPMYWLMISMGLFGISLISLIWLMLKKK